MLVDAQAVLGVDRYYEIDEKYAHTPIVAALHAAQRDGSIDATDLDVLGQLLLGALMQGGDAHRPRPRPAPRPGLRLARACVACWMASPDGGDSRLLSAEIDPIGPDPNDRTAHRA